MRFYFALSLLFIISCQGSTDDKKKSNKYELEVNDTPMADLIRERIPKEDSISLFACWEKVMSSLQKDDIELFKKNSLDTVYCQACATYPIGSNVEDIPVRYLQLEKFVKFYKDSFLFPAIPHYLSKKDNIEADYFFYSILRPKSMSLKLGDSIKVYRIRFKEQDNYSLNYNFIKDNGRFKFFGLYL